MKTQQFLPLQMLITTSTMIMLMMSLIIMSANSFSFTSTTRGLATTTPHRYRVKQNPQLLLILSSNDATKTHRHNSWKLKSTKPTDNKGNDNNEDEDTELKKQVEVTADSLTPSQIQALSSDSQSSFLEAVKSFFSSKKGKFSRESLGKMGMSALLAYGFVSNVSGVIAVSCAWFIFSKKTGLSPLAPGQKAAFLAIYAGFTVILNVIRPARFALSISISPYFERIRKFLQRQFNVSPRGAAVLMILFINFLGTCSLMCLGVGLASLLSGVPIWAGRL